MSGCVRLVRRTPLAIVAVDRSMRHLEEATMSAESAHWYLVDVEDADKAHRG
jgi:hypothetical protein